MKAVLTALTLAGVLLTFACDDDANQVGTPAATSTRTFAPPKGVSVSAPMLIGDALSRPTPPRMLVVNRTTGLVQALGSAIPHTSQSCAGWKDEDTLIVCVADGWVELDLDGGIRPAGAMDRTSLERRKGDPSASGTWSVAQLASGAGGVIVGKEPGPDWRMRVGEAGYYLWSPTQDLLALLGNRCRGFDLFMLEPQTETLTNLTAAYDEIVQFFIWEPGGSRITAPVIGFGATHGSIVSFDALTGQHEVIILVEGDWMFMPLTWDPSGTKLLFEVSRGAPNLCGDNVEYRDTYLDTVPNFGGP